MTSWQFDINLLSLGFTILPDRRGPLVPNPLTPTTAKTGRTSGLRGALVTEFHLPKSSYATMAIREVMKKKRPQFKRRNSGGSGVVEFFAFFGGFQI